MTKLNYISAVVLLAAASVAHAQTAATAPKLPGDQGATSVNRNLAKDPDNKGLQNAAEQLKENKAKHAAQRTEKQEDKMEKKSERAESREKMERADKIEHPSKVERPEKIERPGK